MKKQSALAAAILLLCLIASDGQTALVNPKDAKTAALHWLAMDNQPLGADLRGTVREMRTFSSAKGSPLYYVVSLSPSGYIILSADDLVEPIIAFSPDGDYQPVSGNPLHDLVVNDLNGRSEHVKTLQTGLAYTPRDGELTAREKWQRLLAGTPGPTAQGIGSVSDPRVDPLVLSKWDQFGDRCGNYTTYNYYTPSNYPCGCLATAMAQIMRFRQWPTMGVGTSSFSVSTCGGTPTAHPLDGGDGLGGPYAWAEMDLDPCYPDNTTRQAIGRLCHDAGVAVSTDYCANGSSAYANDVPDALKSVFGYSHAHVGWDANLDLTESVRNTMINASLHAGYPTILGITRSGDGSGHAAVCDGYGYNSSTMYHHLNMGWSGSYTAWYNLPNVDSSRAFDTVFSCVYNVFTSGSGEIVAGRVTDADGNPVSGATVTAGGSSDTTDSRGIYGIQVPSGAACTVSATKPGLVFTSASVVMGVSVDDTMTCGNRWPVDLTADSGPRVTNVTSTNADGCYGSGTVIYIGISFSEPAYVTGTPCLVLDTGDVDRSAYYSSGAGTSVLTFCYSVQSGDTSSDLCYAGTSSLVLNGGGIKDDAGIDADLMLPLPGDPGSLCYDRAIIIDTTPPTVSTIDRYSPSSQHTNRQSVVWRVSFDESVTEVGTADFTITRVSGAATGYSVVSVSRVNDIVYDVTVNTGSGEGELRLDVLSYALIYDCGNSEYNSSYTSGQTYVVDRTAPKVPANPGVTSTAANGNYSISDVIPIQVAFSEPVSVTGAPGLELETGAVDRKACYSSGSGSSTLTFSYTVQSGDSSPDLDYTSAMALSLNGGTIRDLAGNDAVLTLPAPGSIGSLGYSKNIVIDTDLPDPPSMPDLDASDDTGESSSDNCTSRSTALTLRGDADTGTTVRLWEGSTLLGSCLVTDGTYVVDVGLTEGSHIIEATLMDGTGDESIRSAGLSVTVDTMPPASSAGPLSCTYAAEVINIPFGVTDSGCGIMCTDLWYRARPVSGGVWTGWTSYGSVLASPAEFHCAYAQETEYEFYTIAADKAGNRESAPPQADCGTRTTAPPSLGSPSLAATPELAPYSAKVSWNDIDPLATMYQAQCSRDSSFVDVDQTTGWLARPPDSHIFVGLLAGKDHYFRVRLGGERPALTGGWSQTSQADFAVDACTNVSTGESPGDVVLSTRPPSIDSVGNASAWRTSSAYHQLNSYACMKPCRLTRIEAYLSISVSTALQFLVYEAGTASGPYTKVCTNAVPSSGTGEQFYSSGPIDVGLQAGKYYLIGVAWQGAATGGYTVGLHPQTVAFGHSVAGYAGSGYPPPQTVSGTNSDACYRHRLTSVPREYVSSGAIISLPISPCPFARWDTLTFTRDISGYGTALTVDVLDGQTGVPLLLDAQPGTDLNAANVRAPSIKLRANLSTSISSSTPRLSDWAVSFVQLEPLFVESAWSNVVCCTQLPVYGLATRSTIIPPGPDGVAFKVWGRATVPDPNSFELDYGSAPIRVIAPGHGIRTGDYVEATGLLDVGTNPWTLTSESRLVRKL